MRNLNMPDVFVGWYKKGSPSASNWVTKEDISNTGTGNFSKPK